jgi:flavin reductase (DIM6/NTAB) family NADH-FMN oxidoreductase RutF
MAGKIDIGYTDRFQETMAALSHGGALLVSLDKNSQPNGLTIGWATIGTAWGKPIFMAMIRPSRNTYDMVELTGDFTVNVMPKDMKDMKEVVSFWGTVSGRDHDKFAERGLQAAPSRIVRSPIIAQGIIHYECRVLYKTDLDGAGLPDEIRRSAYPGGDYHRLYFAEIVACYAQE